MNVPFLDLPLQYKRDKKALDQAMADVCASAAFILGPHVERFEKNFAAYVGAACGVGVASGTDALRIILKGLGIEPGDEVLVPANTFIATALAASHIGARPVPVDVDERTFLIDLDDAEKRVTKKTKAIIPVHLFGQCADMRAVNEFAARRGLLVVEDACQAHGAAFEGRRAGTFGSAAAFSFYPGKNLGAFGDGGMITANDPALAETFVLLRNYGSREKYRHEIIGENSRLDGLQAAALDVKLKRLDEWNARRFQAALRYADALGGIPGAVPPAFDRDAPSSHVFHLFVIRCENRDALAAHLNGLGIQSGVHYPVPVHLHPAFRDLGYGRGDFPVSERLAESILSLPIFPEIEDRQIDAVASAVRDFYGS